jgi:hypothetical protein
MNDRCSPKKIYSQSRRQGSGVSLLDALHESRQLQAMQAIDNYRHLLGKTEADEIRDAIEEFTRERVSIRSLCRIWQSHFSWISPLMNCMRAWRQGRWHPGPMAAMMGPGFTHGQGGRAHVETTKGTVHSRPV